MSYDFSPFHPYVWLSFAGFAVGVWAIVKIFHAKYPGYPEDVPGADSDQ